MQLYIYLSYIYINHALRFPFQRRVLKPGGVLRIAEASSRFIYIYTYIHTWWTNIYIHIYRYLSYNTYIYTKPSVSSLSGACLSPVVCCASPKSVHDSTASTPGSKWWLPPSASSSWSGTSPTLTSPSSSFARLRALSSRTGPLCRSSHASTRGASIYVCMYVKIRRHKSTHA